ncbi:DUF4350 domain-containing protein [Thermobifida halotolerans]|uniref:DUF4350 domain-containing protein n=1 Tax=Thermobifida halotolerans TaxID=483545 RepID=A0AA97LUB4_9ACTN|nr:DUF4350 domain-containing protein [Thermobifida halotolerans]UOE18207.1 DUF4350 domain-containing protein [Thermobifida halotolerans]
MTPPPSPPPPAATASSALSPGLAGLWRRLRGPLAFLLVAVGIATVLAWGAQPLPEGPLDPEAPTPEGSRALAQILEDRGSEVTVARTAEEAASAVAPDSVLLVVLGDRLLPEDVERIAGLPGELVLVDPTAEMLDALAPGVEMDGLSETGTPAPRCGLRAAVLAGAVELDHRLYVGGSVACYPGDGGHGLVQTSDGGRTVTVLGSATPLSNERLGHEGNAALLLNLLAGHDVVWFVPDFPESEAPEPESLVHPGFFLSLPVLLAAFALLALWRGRRLGPLVAERLPVVVRASETTEGRARLYASRRARDRAAAALRSGLVGRLRPGLGLGPDATPETVVAAVSARCARSPQEVRVLLYGEPAGSDPFTHDDAGLVRLADELDRLEREVRQS